MNKKLLSLMAAFTLLIALTACGPDAATEAIPEDTTAQTSVPAATEAAAETEDAAEFEEIILVDDENCTFKITGIDEDNLWGYTLKVYLENKTDADLMFSLDDVSVNGYMCDPFWATSVTGSKKANEEISFSDSDFENNDITNVEEISFTLNVYDANNWSADYLVEDSFTVNP